MIVFGCFLLFFCSLFLFFYVGMVLSKLEAGKSKNERGGQKVEQLPVNIKGGSYICNS